MSDDHAGLRKAIAEILPEAPWQRCYVHWLEDKRYINMDVFWEARSRDGRRPDPQGLRRG